MSHRTALALSIALTLILAAGILASRDRLFEVDAIAGITDVASVPVALDTTAPSVAVEESLTTTPRIIEIPLPAQAQSADERQLSAGEHDGDWDRDDDRDHDDDDDRDHDDDAWEHGDDDDD